MSDIKKFEPLWDAWQVESLIGEGSFGKVYKIRQQEFDKISYSAVKIISLPQKSEIEQPEIKGIVSDIASEIEQMIQFGGEDHIINFEDYKIIEETHGIGYDFLIRMELLQPLSHHIKSKPLTHTEIIKIGIHICQALERFHFDNIIHRNIKPENIFVTRRGDYKLGDFGIGRQIQRTQSSRSDKETYSTMAPEVFFKGKKQDAKVDIYALGIMMYSFFNLNRGPFLPEFPQEITLDDHKKALVRRVNGEPIPDLQGINPKLNALVLKACSYNPGSRFASPTEMRLALEGFASESPRGAERLEPIEHAERIENPEPIEHAKPTVHIIPYRTDNSVDQTVSHTVSAHDKAQIHNRAESITDLSPQTTSLQIKNSQLLQTQSDENNHKSALTCAPLESPEIVKKDSFLSRKRRPLLIGLASAMALAVIVTLSLFISTLNDRYSISINGQTNSILSNEEEAQAVLDELKAHYASLVSTAAISVSTPTYEEDIKVVKINARASEVKNKDQALQDLINGQTQTLDYTATEGETIQQIAQKNNVTLESILAENEGLTEESPMAEGTTIKLVVSQPYLHVIIEGVSESTEEINFATETKEDANLVLNTTKVQQQGEIGSKDVTYTVVFKNGVLVEKTVLEEVITKEPVPEIVLQGTKQPRLAVASGNQSSGNLSDDEMLQYIINRESGGNVYATNGKFKGIGQLQEHHYQDHVGMSYAETLQQPEPYAVQLQAMLGYINGRYSSIGAAYNFWLKNGWY